MIAHGAGLVLAGQPALVALAVSGDVLGVVLLELLNLLLCAADGQQIGS